MGETKKIEDEAPQRYPDVTQRAATIAEGNPDSHPADRLRDPPAAILAVQHERAKTAEPRLKHIGGSDDDSFSIALAEATRQTAWITDVASRDQALMFVGKALAAIAPRDEMEAMLAAQMVACHQASLEGFRRAMIPEQTVEAREMNLKAASRASQTYAVLLDALGKHRNRGQQRVVVEHLYVASGGQAIVGSVETGGGRGDSRNPRQPHEQAALAHASEPALRREDEARELVPRAGDEQRPVQVSRRRQPRRSDG